MNRIMLFCCWVVSMGSNQFQGRVISLEYEYALSRAKPIVVFMHEQPESRDMHLQETHPQLKEKFLAFRKSYYMKRIIFLF